MFVTVEQTKQTTGIDVTEQAIAIAQMIIESYVGRIEANISDAADLMLLGRATAYQAVYMRENLDTVFEQIDVKSQTGFGSSVAFRDNPVSPWLAPLAIIACQGLSWKRMRSVRVGAIFSRPVDEASASEWSTD